MATEKRPKFGAFPVTVERNLESRLRLNISGILGFVIGVWLIWDWDPRFGGLVGLVVLGALYWALGFLLPNLKETISIEQDSVTISRTHGQSDTEQWTEPLHSYIAVRWQTRDIGWRSRKGHVVDLNHPDPAKKVILFQSDSYNDSRAVWEEASTALNLARERTAAGRTEDESFRYNRDYQEADEGSNGSGGNGDGDGGGE